MRAPCWLLRDQQELGSGERINPWESLRSVPPLPTPRPPHAESLVPTRTRALLRGWGRAVRLGLPLCARLEAAPAGGRSCASTTPHPPRNGLGFEGRGRRSGGPRVFATEGETRLAWGRGTASFSFFLWDSSSWEISCQAAPPHPPPHPKSTSPASGPLHLRAGEASPPPAPHSLREWGGQGGGPSYPLMHTHRQQPRAGHREGEVGTPAPTPPSRGLARPQSPPLPAPFSRPGRASLPQPSPASSASAPPARPGWVTAGDGSRGAPGAARARAGGRDRRGHGHALGGSQHFLRQPHAQEDTQIGKHGARVFGEGRGRARGGVGGRLERDPWRRSGGNATP